MYRWPISAVITQELNGRTAGSGWWWWLKWSNCQFQKHLRNFALFKYNTDCLIVPKETKTFSQPESVWSAEKPKSKYLQITYALMRFVIRFALRVSFNYRRGANWLGPRRGDNFIINKSNGESELEWTGQQQQQQPVPSKVDKQSTHTANCQKQICSFDCVLI